MRCAEKYKLLKMIKPSVAGYFSVMTGAPGDKAAHAMADDEKLWWMRRLCEYRFKQAGKISAVFRYVQSGIVMDIEGQDAQGDYAYRLS